MNHLQTDQSAVRPDLLEVERGIEERLGFQERSIAAAQRRLRELNERARLASERLRSAETRSPAPEATEGSQDPDQGGQRVGAATDGSLLEMNAVSAEELQTEGLSIKQATRLIAQRERMGGFHSLDEIELIEGIPYDTLLDLKSRSAL